eukprot:3070521-Amphidinium_carterae.1
MKYDTKRKWVGHVCGSHGNYSMQNGSWTVLRRQQSLYIILSYLHSRSQGLVLCVYKSILPTHLWTASSQ